MSQWLRAVTILFSLGYFFVAGTENQIYNESKERYSSSTVGLLKLLKLEQQFVENLIALETDEESETIQAYLFSINYKMNRSPAEKLEYVSNPLSAFSLVRRTHEDLPKWYEHFKLKLEMTDMAVLNELLAKIPDGQDYWEAALGIQRIERIYDLRVDDLAEGRLQDKQYSIGLTFRDRIAMGHLMFKQRDYQAAAKWYRMASKLEPQDDDDTLNEILGDPEDYLNRQYLKAMMIYGWMLYDPTQNEKDTLNKVEESLANASQDNLDDLLAKLHRPENDMGFEKELYEKKRPASDFEKGCRGQFPAKLRLTCRYNYTTTPFLRLAPLKMEEISLNPYIVMYHEVLYDSEIEALKGQSDRLSNAFADPKNGSMIRELVARHVWWSEETPIRKRINQRIIDMTGLNITITEEIQIANYGLGTYFKPHFDYTSDGYQTPNASTLGDRLVTVLFYASEVPQGGATVFPELKISIYPRKGSSLWWFNLYDDGTPDTRSHHSVCPVINGDRWTLTMWIHLFPQMFIAPCGTRK